MSDPWVEMDLVTSRWAELEKILADIRVRVDGLPLSIERGPNGKLQIFYQGRPMNECKAAERIEAVGYIGELVEARKKARGCLAEKAREATEVLATWLDKLAGEA